MIWTLTSPLASPPSHLLLIRTRPAYSFPSITQPTPTPVFAQNAPLPTDNFLVHTLISSDLCSKVMVYKRVPPSHHLLPS